MERTGTWAKKPVDATWWLSRYFGTTGYSRGPIANNVGYTDSSVTRFENVLGWQYADNKIEGMDRIPLQYDARRAGFADRFLIPRK